MTKQTEQKEFNFHFMTMVNYEVLCKKRIVRGVVWWKDSRNLGSLILALGFEKIFSLRELCARCAWKKPCPSLSRCSALIKRVLASAKREFATWTPSKRGHCCFIAEKRQTLTGMILAKLANFFDLLLYLAARRSVAAVNRRPISCAVIRAPTRGGGGPMPRGGTFREGSTFGEMKGKWSFTNEPELDLGLGFTFWLRLDLPYVPVWAGLSRFKRLCRCPVLVSKLSRNFTSVKFSKLTPAWWCIVMK